MLYLQSDRKGSKMCLIVELIIIDYEQCVYAWVYLQGYNYKLIKCLVLNLMSLAAGLEYSKGHMVYNITIYVSVVLFVENIRAKCIGIL